MTRINKAILITGFALIVQGGFPPAAAENEAPGGRQRGFPPEEALQACSRAAEADPCQFTAPQREISGSCLTRRESLVCVPAGGPPHGFARRQPKLESENAE